MLQFDKQLKAAANRELSRRQKRTVDRVIRAQKRRFDGIYQKKLAEYGMYSEMGVHYFQYHEHISDNDDFVKLLVEDIRANKMVLLDSKCGSGKSYFVAVQLKKMLQDAGIERYIVIVEPVTVTTQQLAEYKVTFIDTKTGRVVEKNVKAITGASGNKFSPDDQVYSVVMDMVPNIDALDLSKVCLIVDEAHTIPSCRKYRKRAAAGLEKVQKRVIDCGGSVIHMTATPDRIRCNHYDDIIVCDKIDENGKVVNPVQINKLRMLLKDCDHGGNMVDLICNVILECYKHGKRVLVQINDKKKLARVKRILEAQGMIVSAVTSEDKGYQYVNGEKVYNNEAFGALTTNGILPYADAYLVTSLIEVGTSITGVLNADGTYFDTTKFVPIYTVLDTAHFALDSFEQFIFRARFAMDEAYLLLNDHSGDEGIEEVRDIAYHAASFYSDYNRKAVKLNGSETGRGAVRGKDGKREDDGLSVDENGRYYVSNDTAWERGYGWYCTALANNPNALKKKIEETMSIPVEIEKVDAKRMDVNVPENREDLSKLREKAKKYTNDSDFLDAVNGTNIAYSNAKVRDVTSETCGEKYVENLKRVMTATNGVKGLSMEAKEDAAIALITGEDMQLPGIEVTDKDGNALSLAGTIDALLWHKLDEDLTDLGFACAMEDLEAILKIKAGADIRVPRELHPAVMDALYEIAKDAERASAIVQIWNDSKKPNAAPVTKSKFCELACRPMEALDYYATEQEIIMWNGMDVTTKQATNSIIPEVSEIGAAYLLLRTGNFGDGFPYADKGNDEVYAHFAGGFRNKSVSAYDRKMLAECLPGIAKSRFGNYKVDLSPADIGKLLKKMYTYTQNEAAKGGKYSYGLVLRDFRRMANGKRTKAFMLNVQIELDNKIDEKIDADYAAMGYKDMPDDVKKIDDALRKADITGKTNVLSSVRNVLQERLDKAQDNGLQIGYRYVQNAKIYMQSVHEQLMRTMDPKQDGFVHYRRGIVNWYVNDFTRHLTEGFTGTGCASIEDVLSRMDMQGTIVEHDFASAPSEAIA